VSSGVDGPFKILERINDNEDMVELPGEYGISATFNVADLSPYSKLYPLRIWGQIYFKKGRLMKIPLTTLIPAKMLKR